MEAVIISDEESLAPAIRSVITFGKKRSAALKLLIASLILCAAAFSQIRPSPVVSKADADFDKVDASPIPKIQDTMSCVQSNAAAAAGVRIEEQYLFQYRKGYCELFGAILTGNVDGFHAAATDFGEAVAAWPKKTLTEPPAALSALIVIAKLEQGRAADSSPDLPRELEAAIANPNCPATPLMSPAFCAEIVSTAKVWLGWLALRKSDFAKAAASFGSVPGNPWSLWIAARNAQQEKKLAEATDLYEKLLEEWSARQKSSNPDVPTLLGPKPEPVAINYQLGVMDYERERFDSSIARLDAVIKVTPQNSYAIFLRARSKDRLQQLNPALDDYLLAAQTAKMNGDTNWNVGQAHYFRGLVFYRLKDFARAESEFSNALASPLSEIPASDVTAWRAMAAVSGGGCKTSTDALESTAQSTTDQFPKAEAAALVINCRLKQASNLEEYLALEKKYGEVLDAARLRDLRNRISAAYADQGVAAEDNRNIEAAIAAYRRSIEWNPANPKARFNLGAIYIENKNYEQAEAEYRALMSADAKDFEAQYWLAQSILAQHPPQERIAEACEVLRRSLAVPDPQKKVQFNKAYAAAKCSN